MPKHKARKSDLRSQVVFGERLILHGRVFPQEALTFPERSVNMYEKVPKLVFNEEGFC